MRFLIFLFVPFFLFSNLTKNDIDKDLILYDIIDLYSGSYIETTTDLIVEAPDPLKLIRSYDGNAWHILDYITIKTEGNALIAYTNEGTKLVFEEDDEGYNLQLPKHYTNDVTNGISGNTYLGNYHLSPENNGLLLIDGEGNKKHYILQGDHYRLNEEILLSGNCLDYLYEKGKLKKIMLFSSQDQILMGYLEFEHLDNQMIVYGSNKKRASYFFQEGNLEKIIDSQGIEFSYLYKQNTLFQVQQTGYAPLHFTYDKGKITKIDKNNEPLFSLSYFDSQVEVVNALQEKKEYLFSEDKLHSITTYADREFHQQEKKYWKGSMLLSKAIIDAEGNAYACQTFSYDSRGNILAETLWGSLTGAHRDPFKIDETGRPIGDTLESHTTSFTYKEDFNLPSNRKDRKGVEKIFQYKNGTNLLTNNTTLVNMNNHQLRHFFSYDDGGNLIEEILDDGSFYYQPAKLDSVTERHIKRIKPKKTFPSYGSPLEIEELIYDFQAKSEVVIRKTVFHYDSYGYTIQKDVYGKENEFAYSLFYTYDEKGNLLSETTPLGECIHYTYDNANRLTRKDYAGHYLCFDYDKNGNLIHKRYIYPDGSGFTKAYSYDVLGNRTLKKDQFGKETRYFYNKQGKLSEKISPSVENPDGTSIVRSESWQYDILGHLESTTDARGCKIQYINNIRGQPVKIAYPDQSFELYYYDTEGSLYRRITRDKITFVYKHDNLGRVSSVRHFAENQTLIKEEVFIWSVLRLKREFISDGHDSNHQHDRYYSYNSLGQLCKTEYGNKVSDYYYDFLGRRNRTHSWYNDQRYTVYIDDFDLEGRILEQRTENMNGKVYRKKQFAYDPFDRLTQEINFPNNEPSITYQCSYADPRFEITNAYGDSLSIEEQVADHRIVYLKEGNGTTALTHYNSLNLPYLHTKHDSQGILLQQEEHFYDANGNTIETRNYRIENGLIADIQTSQFSYNSLGEKIEEIAAVGTPQEKKMSWTYNDRGQLTQSFNSNHSHPINYQYSNRGKLSKVTFHELGKEKYYEYKWGDYTNVLISATSSDGFKVIREYISKRLTKEITETPTSFTTINFSYDKQGRLTQQKYTSNACVNYFYNAADLVGAEFHQTLCSEPNSVNPNPQPSSLLHQYLEYDLMGNLLKEQLPFFEGECLTYYDQAGSKTGIKTKYYQETIETRNERGFPTLQTQLTPLCKKTTHYEYDSLDHLIADSQGTYRYDSLGNLVQSPQGESVFDGSNALTSHPLFTQKQKGETLTRSFAGESQSYIFNAFDQLVEFSNSSGEKYRLQYDPLGRLLFLPHRANESPKELIYSGHTPIAWTQDHYYRQFFPPGLNDKPFLFFSRQQQISIPIYDLQGNIALLVDQETASPLEYYLHSPFGEEEIFTQEGQQNNATIQNPFRYQGAYKDPTTNLVLFSNRLYDPTTHRFLTPDPLGTIDGPNPYIFCRNNPLIFQDPTGFSSEEHPLYTGKWEPTCPCKENRLCQRGGDIFASAGTAINDWASSWSTTRLISTVPGLFTSFSMMVICPPLGVTSLLVTLFYDEIHQILTEGTSSMLTTIGLSDQYAPLIASGILTLGDLAIGRGYANVGSAFAKKGSQSIGKTFTKEGIYEFTDKSGKVYCGQSKNIPKRLNQHIGSKKLDPNQSVKVKEVLGGKTAREIAEHKRIQELTLGKPARRSKNVSNMVDPIGPKRRHLLDQD